MKEKQMACFVLLLFVGFLVYFTQGSYKKLTAARKEAYDAKAGAQTAQTAFNLATVQLNKLKKDTQGKRDFHAQWEPFLKNTANPEAAEQKVIDCVKSAGVFAVSQRFEKLQRQHDPLMPYILRAHLIIEDEYSKAFNWLGELEETLPTSRISSLQMKRGESGDDLRLELIVDVPVMSS